MEVLKQEEIPYFIDSKRKKTHTPFEFEEVRVTVCDEEYVLNLYNATSWDDIVIKRKIYQNADVFLVLFSVVDPVSYSSVTKHWIQAMIDNLPSASTMLVGCEKCQRSYNLKPFQKLKTLPRRSITSEMGERLAQKINAVKYMECSNLTDWDWKIFTKKLFGLRFDTQESNTEKP